MLRLHQSSPSTSSSSSSSSSEKNLMEQKQSSALLHHHRRLYQEQTNSWHNQDTRHVDLLSAVDLSHHFPYHSIPKPEWQCNSGSLVNTEKRKAQFDIEENNENLVEAEEEKSEITAKTEMETSGNTCSKESSKVSEVQKPDYIHVRARRGQATDSHSLAERARREKISKKMKCLQDLVPGCNKVTGKAGMLDEIINYVQSLQKQVEFLSMKLATVNPRLDFNVDDIFAKEIPAYISSLQAAQFEATCLHYNTIQQGTSSCGGDISLDQSQMLLHNKAENALLDPSFISQLQQLSGWESDWPSLFNSGFH
ncbi:hypothetical protein ABFX02_08G077600 [Erythranthe guttata]